MGRLSLSQHCWGAGSHNSSEACCAVQCSHLVQLFWLAVQRMLSPAYCIQSVVLKSIPGESGSQLRLNPGPENLLLLLRPREHPLHQSPAASPPYLPHLQTVPHFQLLFPCFMNTNRLPRLCRSSYKYWFKPIQFHDLSVSTVPFTLPCSSSVPLSHAAFCNVTLSGAKCMRSIMKESESGAALRWSVT